MSQDIIISQSSQAGAARRLTSVVPDGTGTSWTFYAALARGARVPHAHSTVPGYFQTRLSALNVCSFENVETPETWFSLLVLRRCKRTTGIPMSVA
jgi:hypothetical protein